MSMRDKSITKNEHYANLQVAREAMLDGRNVLEVLRKLRGSDSNSIEEIELSYDLQSGSYSKAASLNLSQWREYGAELASHLFPHIDKSSSFLDCGTGELTSLSSIDLSGIQLGEVFALDLSWSRLAVGREFVRIHGSERFNPTLICGDILNMPFKDDSIDVVMTVHALEPNGGREKELLAEILRIANKKVVLFEPCFERSPVGIQERMISHGYVRNLETVITRLGGEIVDIVPFQNSANPLNPTWVFVINPPRIADQQSISISKLSCPITRTALTKEGDWLHSRSSGLSYPILQEISLLRSKHAVLSSAMTFSTLS